MNSAKYIYIVHLKTFSYWDLQLNAFALAFICLVRVRYHRQNWYANYIVKGLNFSKSLFGLQLLSINSSSS